MRVWQSASVLFQHAVTSDRNCWCSVRGRMVLLAEQYIKRVLSVVLSGLVRVRWTAGGWAAGPLRTAEVQRSPVSHRPPSGTIPGHRG
jgi:hypothetical protein